MYKKKDKKNKQIGHTRKIKSMNNFVITKGESSLNISLSTYIFNLPSNWFVFWSGLNIHFFFFFFLLIYFTSRDGVFYRPVYLKIFFPRNRPVPVYMHEHVPVRIKQYSLTWTCQHHVDMSTLVRACDSNWPLRFLCKVCGIMLEK